MRSPFDIVNAEATHETVQPVFPALESWLHQFVDAAVAIHTGLECVANVMTSTLTQRIVYITNLGMRSATLILWRRSVASTEGAVLVEHPTLSVVHNTTEC